jgi:hypothetical protein
LLAIMQKYNLLTKRKAALFFSELYGFIDHIMLVACFSCFFSSAVMEALRYDQRKSIHALVM